MQSDNNSTGQIELDLESQPVKKKTYNRGRTYSDRENLYIVTEIQINRNMDMKAVATYCNENFHNGLQTRTDVSIHGHFNKMRYDTSLSEPIRAILQPPGKPIVPCLSVDLIREECSAVDPPAAKSAAALAFERAKALSDTAAHKVLWFNSDQKLMGSFLIPEPDALELWERMSALFESSGDL